MRQVRNEDHHRHTGFSCHDRTGGLHDGDNHSGTRVAGRLQATVVTRGASDKHAGPARESLGCRDPAARPGGPNHPWAVVSAYYGDVESQNYAQAWALLNSGATTGQTYQQFVDGYACTGSQQVEETGESGDQVTFSLAATDTCTGAVQHYTGTDTVQNGKIVAASIHQSG